MHYRRQIPAKKTIKDGDKERQPGQGQEESDRDRGKRDKYEGCGGFGLINSLITWYGAEWGFGRGGGYGQCRQGGWLFGILLVNSFMAKLYTTLSTDDQIRNSSDL